MFANNVIATKLTLDLFSFKLLPESNPSIYAEPAKKPLRVYLRKKEKKKARATFSVVPIMHKCQVQQCYGRKGGEYICLCKFAVA